MYLSYNREVGDPKVHPFRFPPAFHTVFTRVETTDLVTYVPHARSDMSRNLVFGPENR